MVYGVCVGWCFAWLVWLLYACGVRRFYGLWRVCLSFCPFASVFLLLCLLSCFACPLCQLCLFMLSLWLFGCVVGVAFSLAVYAQKGRNFLASSLVLLWVALFCCCFVLCELVRTQSVNIVTKFYIKIFAAGAAYGFAFACVLTCIVVFPFHISCV